MLTNWVVYEREILLFSNYEYLNKTKLIMSNVVFEICLSVFKCIYYQIREHFKIYMNGIINSWATTDSDRI